MTNQYVHVIPGDIYPIRIGVSTGKLLMLTYDEAAQLLLELADAMEEIGDE